MSQVLDTSTTADGRDRRWDDHRQERRERLLSTALRLIDQHGGEVGVASIASEAGIPRSVVYKLFRDREDLDEQIRLRIVAEMTEVMAPVLVPRGTIRKTVQVAVETYVGWVSAHSNLHRFLGAGSGARPTHGGSPVITGGKAAFAGDMKVLIDSLIPLLAGGVKPPRGLSENLAYALLGQTDSAVNRWLLAGRSRSSKKDLIRFLADAACGVIEAGARISGGPLDVDAPLA